MAAESHAEGQQVMWIFDQHPKLQNISQAGSKHITTNTVCDGLLA